MKKLICTSYNNTENGLVLRNNWIEEYSIESLNKWNILEYKISPETGLSHILKGIMEIPNVIIHVRILEYK